MERAETGRSRKVPGLKYAFVYRDNWTRLNAKPAKIMQQRYMIAAVKDLSEEPTGNQDSAKVVANYLEACNLIFENGLLSRRRINSLNSPVIHNIKKGMDFFEKWCLSHEETVYPDNTKKSRQTWQTWDLLRVVVHGFLLFCEWFFTCVCSDGSYFI
ncbi:uncharacterized protein LOC141879363 [Acropora palmata]|uniref:uncharacterized protein LOC141879363 n=1 Tax=Acropora palmata TaxID=6131 RepID=UPI003DA152A9